jgi:hypothetical protein
MLFDQKKIAQEQIWKYLPLELEVNAQVEQVIHGRSDVVYRIVDSLFFEHPAAWNDNKLIVTDNIPLRTVQGTMIPLYPEYWHVYHYRPTYQNRSAIHGYNCFMNRISEERGLTFRELNRRNLLSKGLVSFNCLRPGNLEATKEDLLNYGPAYNNLIDSLEQSIIDSNISLVLETYTSDDHITFSEKIFRVLQLPRPWLLYCSPKSVEYLKQYGFDVLDDYVDHSYDQIIKHHQRLSSILDQLETVVDRVYNEHDYIRFEQAAKHNQNLLLEFRQVWPEKFNNILNKIKQS